MGQNIYQALVGLKSSAREQTHHVKRNSGNMLIQWDFFKNIVTENTVCKHYRSNVYLNKLINGVATQVKHTCQNQKYKMNVANKINNL